MDSVMPLATVLAVASFCQMGPQVSDMALGGLILTPLPPIIENF
jgi:hypothetical protein